MCQERANVNVPLGSHLVGCSCIANDCDEPVTVLPNVENHVSLHIVGILERAANLQEIVPSSSWGSRPTLSPGRFALGFVPQFFHAGAGQIGEALALFCGGGFHPLEAVLEFAVGGFEGDFWIDA